MTVVETFETGASSLKFIIMKTIFSFLFFVALCLMTTTTYAQLSNGSQYRVFSEADPAHGIYGTEPFYWGHPDESGSFLTANNFEEWATDVWQFEYETGRSIRTAGGGKTACATSTNPTGEASNRWKLIPDGDLVDGVQYYLLQSQHNAARYMYFNPDDKKLYTNDAGVPDDETRTYYRVGFAINVAPVLSVSAISLVFSSPFLSKDITIEGQNVTSDITFTVPEGISLRGTNVVDNEGNYSIPAANGNEENTVTITASATSVINGNITIASAGANAREIIVKSGLKEGVWYIVRLFHPELTLNMGASTSSSAQPALATPDPTSPDQVFTFVPVSVNGTLETFKLKNVNGTYLLGKSGGTTAYDAITVSNEAEWTLDRRNGISYIDYFEAMTLKVGSRLVSNPSQSYLGHGSSGVDAALDCSSEISGKGTYKLIEAKAVIINYLDADGNALKDSRVQLADLVVGQTYTAPEADKVDIIVGEETYRYNASSIDQALVGNGNVAINLEFTTQGTGIEGSKIENNLVFANDNRQIVISAKAAANQKVVIYNVTGQKIAEKTLNAADNSLDVSGAGVYLVKIGNNGVSKTHKVILK
jgi:hypothetical protein